MHRFKRTFGFIFNHPLGRKHKFKSLLRFFLWQLQSRFSSDLVVKSFISNVRFYARRGLTGVTGNIYTGLHEFNDMCFLLHFLCPEDVFFDVGANAGSYTLLASGVNKAKSVTIEPVPATFYILSKNVALNRLEDVITLINSAAGAEKGILNFSSDEDTTNHVINHEISSAVNVISVPVTTIDALLSNGVPSLIKIDVEGFETEVMKGMNKALDEQVLKAIIIELNGSGLRYGYNETAIHDLLLTKNFRPYSYDPFKRLLSELKTFGHDNTIYCRDLDFINKRIVAAAPVSIFGESV